MSEMKNWFLEAGTYDLVGPFPSWSDAYDYKEQYGPWQALIIDVDPDDPKFQTVTDEEDLEESVLMLTPEQYRNTLL
jgi:hypothetical protein